MSSKKFIVTFFLLFILSACKNEATSIKSTATIQPTLPATPALSQSAINGQVISISNGNSSPLSNTEVRLANVFWSDDKSQGSFVIDESASPITRTDINGNFIFNELEPRDYVIVIGDLYKQNVILSNVDGSARIFTAEGGELLDVGMLQIDLEPLPIYTPSSSSKPYPPDNTPTKDPTPYP